MLQLIVTKAGRLLVNMEHTWLDGMTLKRLTNEALQDSIDRPAVSPGDTISNADHSQTVRKVIPVVLLFFEHDCDLC